jgi:hypothetical protein
VVHALADVPNAWHDLEVHRLGRATLSDTDALRSTVASLRDSHLARRPCVVLLDPAVPWDVALAPERERGPLWTLGADHRLLRDELTFLLADLVDARGGTPVWWPTVRAARLGCSVSSDPTFDVLLPDERRAHLVGGPRGARGRDGAHGAGCATHDRCMTIHRESVELVGRADVERDRPPSEPLSSWQRSRIGRARPGCSHQRARARPGCSPHGCATSSTTEACSPS